VRAGDAPLTRKEIHAARVNGVLSLRGRNLGAVPDVVFTLGSLTELDLSGNGLIGLPPEIGQLTTLKALYLANNELTALPAELARLVKLQTLDLGGNRLPGVPPGLAALHQLVNLRLSDNELTRVPSVVLNLRTLNGLRLDGNKLTVLPKAISQLRHLQRLHLNGNNLRALPPTIGKLVNLVTLSLEDNEITELPAEIEWLGNLATLTADRNKLTAFPVEITELTDLRKLSLSGNRITELPTELAPLLDDGLKLDLSGNPLKEPLPTVLRRGTADLAAFLRDLAHPAPQYEAKVMLLGEGNVGKTSLSAALSGGSFEEQRPSTPGIAISSLRLPHPDLPDVEMTLRIWDFGGQEDYRITHQLFISQRALYLVMWYPRQGWASANVSGWLRGITLRVGRPPGDGGVRVITVATHSDDGRSSADFPRLETEFPGMLAGHFEIDSRSGAGLEELRAAIAAEAAKLPQMGSTMGAEWGAARREVVELAKSTAHITFGEFTDICVRQGVPEDDVRALARLLHDLGQIVYYDDDKELREIVVLNPDWLTRAISWVLDDKTTRDAGGVLDHTRLARIWGDRPGAAGYPREQYPFFLRLMEKFDVSYRLDDEEKSLIAQLVPAARPDLPWESGSPLAVGTRSLAIRCRLSEPAPGLIAWLTVRLHRSSTGRHWRRGVFLRHWKNEQEAEALIELRGDFEVAIEVRAPAPDYFFSVLIESLEYLLTVRWPGLRYDLLVPCPAIDPDGLPCRGEFKLRNLQRRRIRGRPMVNCQECDADHDVERLLTGFPGPLPLHDHLDQRLTEILDSVERTGERVGLAYDAIHRLLTAANQEVTDCPRLFSLTPRSPSGAERLTVYKRHYELTLWCEHPGGVHPVPEAAYTVGQPKEWFVKLRPYAAVTLKALQIAVPIAGAVVGLALTAPQLDQMRVDLDAMRELVEETEHLTESPPGNGHRRGGGSGGSGGSEGSAGDGGPPGQLTHAEGASLRELRELLFRLDPDRWFGGLERAHSVTGGYLWLCPEHHAQYDRGLPRVPPRALPAGRPAGPPVGPPALTAALPDESPDESPDDAGKP
jgi:internalin A